MAQGAADLFGFAAYAKTRYDAAGTPGCRRSTPAASSSGATSQGATEGARCSSRKIAA